MRPRRSDSAYPSSTRSWRAAFMRSGSPRGRPGAPRPSRGHVRLYRAATRTVFRRGGQQVLPRRFGDGGPRHRAATSRRRPTNRPLVPPIGLRNTVALAVEANRRQQERGRDMSARPPTSSACTASMVGDVPYDAMTVAMVEHDRPGGHSPGYFAVLNNPLPVTPFLLRNDPAVFIELPGVLHRARVGPSMVGTSRRLEELSRAVAQRRVRAVLRGALCQGAARRADVSRRAPAVSPLGNGPIGSRCGVSGVSARPHQERQPGISSARLQQGRRGAAHAAAADGRRSFFRG